MPERVDFWGIPTEPISPAVLVYIVMGLSSLVLFARLYLRARLWWSVGRGARRWDRPMVRIGRLVRYAVVQTRVLGQRYPGVMHAALAWGFFAFFLGTALATLDSHFVKFLTGNVFLLYKFVLDTFTVAFLIGAGMAAYRRFVQRPERLTLTPGFATSLGLIVVIVVGGLLVESLRLAVEQPDWALASPFGWLVAQGWLATGASAATLTTWHYWMWLFHLFMVAVLLMTLPAGTLLHVLTGPLNVFFSKTDRPTGALAPLAIATGGKPVFVDSLADLTWKQLLDADACTECGRCQDACPAFGAGTPLSPKALIVSLRDALRRDGPALARSDGKAAASGGAGAGSGGAGAASGGAAPAVPALVGETVADDVLWSCTTCGACVRECPVLIEHVDAIVDMRRRLVIDGRMDGQLQEALDNLGRYGNSLGKSPRMRAKWTGAIEPKIKDARTEPVDYLWFVGDYASFSPSLTETTQKTAAVFRAAGLDFGILYDAEQNAGNDVRRVGEEGLFDMLVEKNEAVLARCTFKTIVTTDPHTYNALKHEYPAGATPRPVIHYSELLDQLIASGQLKLTRPLARTVTYHDPCYLGRYNGVYDAPRRVIAATGCQLIEMPRHADRALCCGAGGGRIWMAEGEMRERPSEARIREAAALDGVSQFVVACPKDVTMYQDAVKTTGQEARMAVRDLIDLVHEAL
jgi:Fe-S oxidoreductase